MFYFRILVHDLGSGGGGAGLCVENISHYKSLRTEVVHSSPQSRLTRSKNKECSACISSILLDTLQINAALCVGISL